MINTPRTVTNAENSASKFNVMAKPSTKSWLIIDNNGEWYIILNGMFTSLKRILLSFS
jgi:hypothetical protein